MTGPIPAARVAWYVTGRFYETAEGSIQDLGYFLHLEGIQAPLFLEGQASEATALLTFRSDPFAARTVVNGDLSVGLDTVGGFDVYLNRQAGASFEDPDSFSRGERIARFRRTSVVMGVTLTEPAFSTNVFSADLVASAPFELGGERYNLRDLLPGGVTQWGTASATLQPVFAPFTKIVAFVGSAVAGDLR